MLANNNNYSSKQEHLFDEDSVVEIMHWADIGSLLKEVILSKAKYIRDIRIYVLTNINDIKVHHSIFFNPAIDRLYRLKEFVEGAVE